MPPRLRSFAEQSAHYFLRDHVKIPNLPVESPAAWLGSELAGREAEWRVPIGSDELEELEAELDRLEAENRPLQTIDRSVLRLPTLATQAETWRDVLMEGRGFLVLSSLPVGRWSERRAALAFWLIGHLLGLPGAQNAAGELLGHVVDYGEQTDSPHVRLYRTASDIGFHCDGADIVGLLCLQTPRSGGASRIASSVAIWNALVEEEPEAAALLFEPFAVDRRDEQPEGQRPWFEIPPCRFGADGRLRTFYHGEYFRSVERLAEIGPLSEQRRTVLERYDAIGNDPAFRLDMTLASGDVQLLSNHTIVHARTAYEDAADQKRHLLRLWLSVDRD